MAEVQKMKNTHADEVSDRLRWLMNFRLYVWLECSNPTSGLTTFVGHCRMNVL